MARKKNHAKKKDDIKNEKDPYDEALEILKEYNEGNPPEELVED